MKRIDLEEYESYGNSWNRHDGPKLLQALKEAYDELDKLNRALSVINNTHFPKE